ncbi:MAG: glycoside hydrolase family 3 N-terminal domain-containing protein [Clostridia bacterium]
MKANGRGALALLLLCAWMAVPCGARAQGAAVQSAAERALAGMTLNEKVCQLFFVRPEDFSRLSSVTKASARLHNAQQKFAVGGVVLFPGNLKNGAQVSALNAAMQQSAKEAHGIGLFIGVDEEGGGVARVANTLKLAQACAAASDIGATGDAEAAYEAGGGIGSYLSGYGFTLDFAPVADVRADVKNAEITARSFGTDAALVSEMVGRFVSGLREQGVLAVLKHFPGHGAASGSSHNGSAVSTRTAEDWRACEWLPFQAGIAAGARVVMMSHQVAMAVDGKSPASLSYRIVTELLRGELGFDGIVITDALRMDAVANEYSSGEACVQALLAGCDMLLLPKNFTNGYKGVVKALQEGRLTEERVNESVLRILRVKEAAGLLE